MNKSTVFTAIAALFFSTFALAESCMPIGGVGVPNFTPNKDGTINITAPLIGSVNAASGTILRQRETRTGLEMDVQHNFMNDKGGFFQTNDLSVLTKIPGRKGRYMIEISYEIDPSTASGTFAGYQGNFKSYGLVDLNKMQGLVRYSGEICKAS